MADAPAPRTARARARAELTREIKDVARRQLAEHGSAGLSLRAVSRELGMVSSAVYRYFPSRDDLLTALIIDAYNDVGSAAETAEAVVRRRDLRGRWLAATGSVRDWARSRPQEYALIFGSPVPGYAAPPDTIDPAARVPLLLLRMLADGAAEGRSPVADPVPLPRVVRHDLQNLRQAAGTDISDLALLHGVTAWTAVIGTISFELFGHLTGTITDYDAYFDHQMRRIAHELAFHG